MTPAELGCLKLELQACLSAAAEGGQTAMYSFSPEALSAHGAADHQGPFAVVTGNENDPSIPPYALSAQHCSAWRLQAGCELLLPQTEPL